MGHSKQRGQWLGPISPHDLAAMKMAGNSLQTDCQRAHWALQSTPHPSSHLVVRPSPVCRTETAGV